MWEIESFIDNKHTSDIRICAIRIKQQIVALLLGLFRSNAYFSVCLIVILSKATNDACRMKDLFKGQPWERSNVILYGIARAHTTAARPTSEAEDNDQPSQQL